MPGRAARRSRGTPCLWVGKVRILLNGGLQAYALQAACVPREAARCGRTGTLPIAGRCFCLKQRLPVAAPPHERGCLQELPAAAVAAAPRHSRGRQHDVVRKRRAIRATLAHNPNATHRRAGNARKVAAAHGVDRRCGSIVSAHGRQTVDPRRDRACRDHRPTPTTHPVSARVALRALPGTRHAFAAHLPTPPLQAGHLRPACSFRWCGTGGRASV